MGVDWPKVLPVWFKALAATAEPEEYAGRITNLLSRHCRYDRDKMLAIARRMATTEQRAALVKVKRRSKLGSCSDIPPLQNLHPTCNPMEKIRILREDER